MNKTEKEKMLAGELYDPGDPQLLSRWYQAHRLMKEYANADLEDRDNVERIFTELVGSRGENVWVAPPFFVDYGENIHFGDNCEVNMNCTFLDCNRITIGDNTGIGPNVQIFAVTHPITATERLATNSANEFSFWLSYTAPVTIGRNVWIGGGAIILAGVTIGDNTTIGAGSVVTKSIPANCLAAGNPCKIIRML